MSSIVQSNTIAALTNRCFSNASKHSAHSSIRYVFVTIPLKSIFFVRTYSITTGNFSVLQNELKIVISYVQIRIGGQAIFAASS